MTSFNIAAECRSCGNEQSQLVDMPADPSDADVASALDEQAHDCDECGDQDWSPMSYKEHVA